MQDLRIACTVTMGQKCLSCPGVIKIHQVLSKFTSSELTRFDSLIRMVPATIIKNGAQC